MWAPSSRTNFIRVTLAFPDPLGHISALRAHQMKILALLKNKTFKSGIQGQNQARLWATKNKSPEERARVRACVLTKVFFQSLPALPGKTIPEPEIIWQGRVFIGDTQVLFHVERRDPEHGDCYLPDNRGNHMEWYISAKAFQQATGRDAVTLQECYATHGGSSTRV